jgi:hypothetical protein
MATVKTQAWVKGVVKRLERKEEGTFLEGIVDYSKYAENDVLHLTADNIEPEVLINNTTYPIPIQEFADDEIDISLDKYQTKATSVTDDELYAATYDKIGLVKDRHGDAISKSKFAKALHAICPAGNTAKTPIIKASGADDGTGRKRLTRNDIIRLKTAYDEAEFQFEGRRLVLNAQHIGDLLLEDKDFKAEYTNHKTGKISNLYDFDVYQTISAPHITLLTLVKKSFGAIPAAGDYKASVSFIADAVCKAKGSTKMYFSEAKNSPTTQRNLINFRHRYIVLPIKVAGVGAIV